MDLGIVIESENRKYEYLFRSADFHRWFVFMSACVVMMNGFGLINSIGSLLTIVMETFKTSRAEAVLIQSMASGGSGIMGKILKITTSCI